MKTPRAIVKVILILLLVALPLASAAQPARPAYQVGLVSLAVDPEATPTPLWQAFLEAMRERNYLEGGNLVVRRAFANGHSDRLPGLINDLVRSRVDVIVTSAGGETRIAKQATATIPIVMTVVADPVGEGLVASLARPGSNVTGLSSLVVGLSQKHVELLHEATHSASRFGVISGPRRPGAAIKDELTTAATRLGSRVSFYETKGPEDFDASFIRAKKDGVAGIIMTQDALTYLYRRPLVQAALKHRLPAIYWSREFVEAGGLMAYGANVPALGRRAALFVDKILKGARPADLPIEQPTQFELVINLKTAKALGLTIPPSVLARADEIIDQ